MNINQKTYQAIHELLPSLPNGLMKAVSNMGGGSWAVNLLQVSPEDFATFLPALSEKGYTLYTEREVRENRFLTYTHKDGCVLTVLYTPCNRELCVVADDPAEEGTVLPSREPYRGGEAVCETLLTQTGLCYDLAEGISPFDLEGKPGPDYTGGMLYTLRLEDGSFIVIDGGHERDSNGDLIYKLLAKQAPDPDHIVIAAWIFSHTHGDHVCAFINFGPRYGDKVTVERFIYNFPYVGGLNEPTLRTMQTCFPAAERILAHPGQTYRIRNAVIDMLFGFELIAPNDMTWFNESSLVFSITAEDTKMMFLTDVGPISNKRMCGMYDETVLKSDFIQVAHHGWNGGSYRLNELVGADYVLFNGTTAPMEASWNKYFFEKVTYSNGTVTFKKKEWITEIYRAIEGVDVFTLRQGSAPEAKVYPTHKDYFDAE